MIPITLELTPNPTTATTEEAPRCAHHWLIEPPSGKLSRGTCKRCGESRDFNNSLDEVAYVPFDRSDWTAVAGHQTAA